MEQLSMDKKILLKAPSGPKTQEAHVSKDIGKKNGTPDNGKKNGAQFLRKREYEKTDNVRLFSSGSNGRKGQRHVRPREKVGGQVKVEEQCDVGSLYRSGGKKQNITHLLNWWAPERRPNQQLWSERPYRGRKPHMLHLKYKKEHFIQANCQFVVIAGNDYSSYSLDPDKLVDWDLVEEVHLHVPSEPSCPICLYPPSAAKVTRCGHIYCFPCILHYLSLSDDKFRTCPICYEIIKKDDLKSVVAIPLKDFNPGEIVEFQLMRRAFDSLVPIPISSSDGSSSPLLFYNKLLVATSKEVVRNVLTREMRELEFRLQEEGDQPEACFIEEAIELVSCRDREIQNPISELGDMNIGSPSSDSSSATDYSFGDNSISSDAGNRDAMPFDLTSNVEELELDKLSVKSVDHEEVGVEQRESQGDKGSVYFFQASNGAHTYLHSINIQMLVKEYGSLEACPRTFKALILEKESSSVTDDLRHRMRCLRHLPVTCPFDMVEVQLGPPIVSQLTVEEFHDKLEGRRRKRNKKEKEEKKIARKVQAEEDRLLGRSRGTCMNITSFKHFPAFQDQPPSEWAESPSVAESFSSVPIDVPKCSSESGPSVSFAQMIREGSTKLPQSGSLSWPHILSPTELDHGHLGRAMPSQVTSTIKLTNPTDQSDESDDEGPPVPDYKSTFSDAFALALNKATQKQTDSKDSSTQNPKGRNKKGRKKGVLLMSSGAALR